MCVRVDAEDYEMTCMPTVMRRGSKIDKFVYKAAMIGQQILCRDKHDGMSDCVRQLVRFMLNAWLCACYKFLYYYYYYCVLSWLHVKENYFTIISQAFAAHEYFLTCLVSLK